MANMGYCRFENTCKDLEDCYEHIDDALSETETEAQKALVRLCVDIAEDYSHYLDD